MSEADEFATSYFIRDRGRVQGPYGLEKVRTFVQRGRLGRHLEVSIDGKSWERAAAYPELFEAQTERKVRKRIPAGSKKKRVSKEETVPIADAASEETKSKQKPSRTWYYHQFGEKFGPVEEEQLRELVKSGEVMEDAHVWAEGMEEWQPVSSTQLLSSLSRSRGTSSPASEDEGRRSGDDKGVRITYGVLDIVWGVFALALGAYFLIYLLVAGEGDNSEGGMLALVITWAVLGVLNGGFFITCGILLLHDSRGVRVTNCIAAGVALLIGLIELIIVFVILAQVPSRPAGFTAFVVILMLAAMVRTISYPIALLVWVNARKLPASIRS